MEASDIQPAAAETTETTDATETHDQAGGGTPEVPHVDHAPQTPEEVQALSQEFADFRREVAAWREEVARSRQPTTVINPPTETLEDRLKSRLEAISGHSHYCPGCGALGKYPQKCSGTDAAPHTSLEMVSTEELHPDADSAQHTAAPPTDPDELARLARVGG